MESAVGIATGRGGSLQMPSSSSSSAAAAAASISSFAQSARKEWRTVSDHHSVRSNTDEELERTNLGQSDERTIYEQGAESLHVDFSLITVDGNLDNDILQQRLHNVCRQREDLQHLEVELRAQFIARSGIMQMQNSFDAQIKDHANATEHLKEQLQEKEHIIHELEIKMEEKNRELRAIKIDNETAWAKEDLLMEQNKELTNFRRELDNSQAERVHNRNQIHELEEYIQEKERQILELKEQHRVAQETILYKDEQLREAQAWVAHAQEMDALQLSTNHSLQTELRDRTEQFNQFWLGYQRQFVDIERHHLQAIQQLQLQLAEARERGGMLTEQSHTAHAHSEDASPFGQIKGNLFNNADGMLNDNSGVLTNGDGGNVSALVSTENASSETDHLSGVPLGPPSLLGVGTYLPPGQMTTMHHFVMHPQGVVHNVPSANLHVPQSNMDNFQPMPAISSHQHRQSHQQAVSEDSQESNQIHYRSAPAQELLRSGAHRDHELALNGQVLYSRDYPNSHVTPGQEVAMVAPQVLESKDNRCLISQHADQIIQGTASKSDSALGLGSLGHCSETKGRDEQMVTVNNHLQERQSLATEQRPAANRVALSDASMDQAITREAIDRNDRDKLTEASILLGSTSNLLAPDKTPEPSLLDERSLLVCIVRAIPAGSGGRVRISSTLPNRLGKMLAPLHWHDYKKKYGKLDDFVANHPELFVIEGDYIQLREGAQEIISATAAVAKVAAAASVPYSSSFPSVAVAVTPMAQTHRLKKVPSNDSKSVAGDANGPAVSTHADTGGKSSQPSLLKNQHSNDVCYDIVQGLSNVKILSKSKDPLQLNGLQPGIRSGHSSMHMAVGNGVVPGLSTSLSKGPINGKYGTNSGGKPQERVAGANLISRR